MLAKQIDIASNIVRTLSELCVINFLIIISTSMTHPSDPHWATKSDDDVIVEPSNYEESCEIWKSGLTMNTRSYTSYPTLICLDNNVLSIDPVDLDQLAMLSRQVFRQVFSSNQALTS